MSVSPLTAAWGRCCEVHMADWKFVTGFEIVEKDSSHDVDYLHGRRYDKYCIASVQYDVPGRHKERLKRYTTILAAVLEG